MKWKAKDKPKLGDTREVKKFALFFPRKVKGYWLWFENYISVQEFSKLYVDQYCSDTGTYHKIRTQDGWFEIYRKLIPHPKDPFV